MSSQTSPAILRADAVHAVRGNKTIVRGATIEARAGDVVAVIGPSGAGKSTLFAALVGELPCARGSVSLAGQDVTDWPLWRRARAGIGYVPQAPSIFAGLSVEANLVTYHRIVHGTPGDPAAAAERVGLGGHMNVPAGELSAGERRRLEVARAVVRTPRVLICDEPFAGVDPAGSERIAGLLRGLAASGVAVILADHHVKEALALATRAVLLLDGEVVTESDPRAFEAHPLVRDRYLAPGAESRGASR